MWRDRNTDEVRAAQRHADYAYRLAVEPAGAKEIRLFGLAGWIVERFRVQRRRLFELRDKATRLRERPLAWSLALVLGANILVFWSMAAAAADGTLALDRVVTYASAAIATSMIAFGGLSWALDGAAAPAAAVLRLEGAMDLAGSLVEGTRAASGMPAREIRCRNVTFAYPGTAEPVLEGFDLTIPAGTSLAIVGQNGAGKTTLAKLLCRLYDPQAGAIEIDGVDLRELDLAAWRSRVAAVFQDFVRFELPLRDNVAPAGAADDVVRARARGCGRGGARRARHRAGTRIRRRHRPFGRSVATGGAGPGIMLGSARCGRGAARRADSPARRARRGRDLRSHSERDPAHHDDPDLAPVLDRAAR